MNKTVLRSTFIALFAAIICLGSFIKIPIGLIPIVLQNMLCILCAVLLGGLWAGAPVALFLIAGLVGLPVYSGGSGGLAVWLGPTGGFLPGYLLGAVAAGFIAGRPTVDEKAPTAKTLTRICLAVIAGMVIIYIPGLIRFSYWVTAAGKVPVDKTALSYTLTACLIPYIPGDTIKTAIAIPLAVKLRPLVAQYLYDEPDKD